MKVFTVLVLIFTHISLSAQENPPAWSAIVPGLTINNNKPDTSLRVLYEQSINSKLKKPAFFLNGQLVNESLISSLKPEMINSVGVVKTKGSTGADDTAYGGKVLITTKNGYQPQPISLTQLKAKYTRLKDKSTLFMIDNSLINADSDTYIVDEKNILRIIISSLKNTTEGIDIALVNLLTRSEQNIKNLETVRIRGNAENQPIIITQ